MQLAQHPSMCLLLGFFRVSTGASTDVEKDPKSFRVGIMLANLDIEERGKDLNGNPVYQLTTHWNPKNKVQWAEDAGTYQGVKQDDRQVGRRLRQG
jgi:hypothetical protein